MSHSERAPKRACVCVFRYVPIASYAKRDYVNWGDLKRGLAFDIEVCFHFER